MADAPDPLWDGSPHWEQEPEVAEKYILYLDKNVENALPQELIFQEIIPHGASYWTGTAQIKTENDCKQLSYFLKVSIGDPGKGMMDGEYISMTRLHDTMPELTPTPISWGTYESDNNIHFFLYSFHNLDNGLCSPETFPKLVAELHTRGVSPNGKFGFPITTYQGRLPQDPTETDTWEECSANKVKIIFDHELTAQAQMKNSLSSERRS